jgi:hypothetical protein
MSIHRRVIAVGDSQGMTPDSHKIQWPTQSIVPDNSIEALMNSIFPGVSDEMLLTLPQHTWQIGSLLQLEMI